MEHKLVRSACQLCGTPIGYLFLSYRYLCAGPSAEPNPPDRQPSNACVLSPLPVAVQSRRWATNQFGVRRASPGVTELWRITCASPLRVVADSN